MTYYTIKPDIFLAPYVRFFWVFESGPANGSPYVYRSMADGCAEMIFHYKGVFKEILDDGSLHGQQLSMIQAPSQHYRRFSTNGQFGIFGAYLYPFALPAIFGVPSEAMCDEMPDLDLLTGQQGRDLEDQMMLATCNRKRVEIISKYLLDRLRNQAAVDERMTSAIKTVIHSNRIMSVEKLADAHCLSTRHFERRFKYYAGFAPKKFSRIMRFHQAMNNYGMKGRSLTDIAYECGYYDQSHFINEFKVFSGYNPKTYFAGGAEGTEYRDI